MEERWRPRCPAEQVGTEGAIALGGYSSDPLCGRVEIYHAGEWGTVCDDGFSEVDAQVVCRSLGLYGGVVNTLYRDGDRSGRIWLDEVGCVGSEVSLSACSSRGWGVHNCYHSEDVGLCCSSEVRWITHR